MLSGEHQAHNAAVAMATIDRLQKHQASGAASAPRFVGELTDELTGNMTSTGTQIDQPERASVRFGSKTNDEPDASAFRLIVTANNVSAGRLTPPRSPHAVEFDWTVSSDAAIRGMSHVRWPMRIEVMSRNPTVIVDAAHNWESATALGRTLDESFPNRTATGERSRRVLIFAATKDKDVSGILRQLAPRFDSIILTKYLNNPRAVPPDQLRHLMQMSGDLPCHVVETPAEAWQLAQRIATPCDLICVTGSFFIAAELRELILSEGNSVAALSQGSSLPIRRTLPARGRLETPHQ
jgi:folylpolyglutamate synthase/dihydropteroate synthase